MMFTTLEFHTTNIQQLGSMTQTLLYHIQLHQYTSHTILIIYICIYYVINKFILYLLN